MIGISRNKDFSKLKNKDIKKIRTAGNRNVVLEDGATTKIPFCSICNNPIQEDQIFLDLFDDEPKQVCSLCYYPRNLDKITFKDSGTLIYAPDLTQSQVNAVALMIYYLRGIENVSQDILELTADVEDLILRRSDSLVNLLCQGANVPSIVCQFLFMLSDDEYSKVGNMFSSVRMFPSEKLAKEVLVYLSTNVLRGYDPKLWVSMLQKIKQMNNE
ncbi:hypothetical protein [Photobacterium kishitanii]|uniref:Uncharacterized protein n=1 Tax=Photobacterium kishitanii TaxID=318456 RepID=A0A2T3KAW3_9GAMM|nr:hypothetical protein [Photobacterium kishitanii]PSU89767.1 hypothetical protein C9J27_24100 [Photobacterium kishitanii]